MVEEFTHSINPSGTVTFSGTVDLEGDRGCKVTVLLRLLF